MQKLNLTKSKPDKTKLVRNLAQGNVLIPFLDRAFQDFDEEFEFKYEPKKHDDAWHPSGDCLPYASDLYDKALYEGEGFKPSGSLRKQFMVGHFWHQLLQYITVEKLGFVDWTAIEREGTYVWKEFNTFPVAYHWLRGSADICPLETKKWRGLVDFKTMKRTDFNQPHLPDWCADKYLCQMQIYMHLFNEEHALIVGINKEDGQFREYEFTRDQDLIDNIIEKWKFVGECLDAGIAPSPEDDEAFLLPFQSSQIAD
jgi:hypothetical protein